LAAAVRLVVDALAREVDAFAREAAGFAREAAGFAREAAGFAREAAGLAVEVEGLARELELVLRVDPPLRLGGVLRARGMGLLSRCCERRDYLMRAPAMAEASNTIRR
jgi:hypothetical protein